MNKATTIMLAALAAFAGFSEDVRTDSAGNVYARFGSLGRNSFVATNVVEGLPLSGGDMAGPLNMGFNPITFNGSTNASEWALWDMLRAWPTGAEGPVLLPFVITNAIAREVDGILDGRKPLTAFSVNLPLGAGMSDPLQNFWVNGTNLHDWVQLLAPVPDLSAELGAFARTGEVYRAANWGTRDRWVDATGVVWRASSDPYLDSWVIEPADQAQGMYVRWDGDSWIWGMEGAEYDTAYDVDTGTISVNFGTGVSYKATRHPGGPAEAVDRVMLVSMSPGDYAAVSNNAMRAMEFSFAASNNVPIASAFGTPDRWTDATGCVWQASSDNDAVWEFFPKLAPGYDVLGVTLGNGDEEWRMDLWDGSDIVGRWVSVGPSAPSATQLAFSFEGIGTVQAVRKKLVGRLALLSDLESATPGDYGTVSNRAMHAVQQTGDTVDIGTFGVVSWGPNSSDYKLAVGDNTLSTGWLFRWQWGTICLPIMEGDNVVALLSDIPSWARANAKPAYTAEEVGAIAATDATNVVRRIVSVTSDYVWDAQAECLYRRSMENQFLYWTPVTNVNALLPENAHILEYLEEHKND